MIMFEKDNEKREEEKKTTCVFRFFQSTMDYRCYSLVYSDEFEVKHHVMVLLSIEMC